MLASTNMSDTKWLLVCGFLAFALTAMVIWPLEFLVALLYFKVFLGL